MINGRACSLGTNFGMRMGWCLPQPEHSYQYMLQANSIANPAQSSRMTMSVRNSESLDF